MSISLIIITGLILVVMLGFGDRFLDKMKMSDRTALIVLAIIAIGIIIPPIKVSNYFYFSIGGFVIPFAICVYLLIRVGFSRDLLRASIGTVITAAAIIGVQYLLPAEPEKLWVDPIFIYGTIAGIVAYVLGRSRRNAFICAVLGITLSKFVTWLINWCMGVKEVLGLGTAGAFDTIIIGVLFAVGFAEFFGKTMEKIFPDKDKKVFDKKTGTFKSEKNGKLKKSTENAKSDI